MTTRRLSCLAGALMALASLAACRPDDPTGMTSAREVRVDAALAGSPGARPNRSDRGTDTKGLTYSLSYQPDWVREITVTRVVDGAPVTSILFANPGYRLQSPGSVIRTHIASPEQGLDFEVTLTDPGQVVKRIIVETMRTGEDGEEEEAVFTISDVMPPPPPPPDSVAS